MMYTSIKFGRDGFQNIFTRPGEGVLDFSNLRVLEIFVSHCTLKQAKFLPLKEIMSKNYSIRRLQLDLDNNRNMFEGDEKHGDEILGEVISSCNVL